jgi:DNA-binding transcriptional LysR family regulator
VNINLLRFFYYAAKLGSVSAAAEALYVTQPAVSKGLQRLQEFYEMKFLNSFGRKLALTDAGEVLYSIAEKIFEMEKQAEDIIHDFQERKRGHIRIISSESFGAYYLPFIIIPFLAENPQVHVAANILPSELVVERTEALDCDLGFVSYPIENSKMVIREILEDKMVVIVPSGHPLGSKNAIEPLDLEGESIIMHESGSAPRRIVDDLVAKYQLSIKTPLELSSNEGIKRAVAAGVGISIVSRNVAGEEIESGKLLAVPFFLGDLKRKFFMVHHKDKYFSETLQDFVDMVFQWADEYAKSIVSVT